MKKNDNIRLVGISEILGHPTGRLDAQYWIGKGNGKKAYRKDKKKDATLVEDDTNGKIMLEDGEADKYNNTKAEIKKLEKSIEPITKRVKGGDAPDSIIIRR